MNNEYGPLIQFVKKFIIDRELEYSQVKPKKSAIRRILQFFEDNDWSCTRVEEETAPYPKHRLTSPDGTMKLSMFSAKVARHPYHTDQICQHKHLTKRMLDFSGIPTAPGADFSLREYNVARAYFHKVPKPVVVKPTNSGGSQGVTVGVNTEDKFRTAWKHAADIGGKHASILVEQFVRGIELRALVIGGEPVSIIARIQPFVIGDGTKTIDQLVDAVNEARKVHFRANQMPLLVDWPWLNQRSFDSKTIPNTNEIVIINPLALPTSGALLVEVSDHVHQDVKKLAADAINAVPDLEVGGVDILIEDLSSPEDAIVLEVNSAPSLNMHLYPTHGPTRDVDIEVAQYFHDQYLETREPTSLE